MNKNPQHSLMKPATTEDATSTSMSNTKEGCTHEEQDEGKGRDSIENMDIAEILTHTSMRIMSKIGEKLKESMCYKGWGNKIKNGHEDTPTIEPTPTPPHIEE